MDQNSLKHEHEEEDDEAHGGHDSPNWSKAKSATVLLSCTVLYSIIAGKKMGDWPTWSVKKLSLLCLF